jgi:predicted MFS family arabinose efflux permease
MITAFFNRLKGMSRDLTLFFIVSFGVALAGSLVDSTLNNYLNDTYTLSGFQRSFLELPRELPGFLVVFVAALLWSLGGRKMGIVALAMYALGVFLIGTISTSYAVIVIFLFIYSMGLHLFMPVQTTMGMELAAEGKTGRRLGQMNSIRNMAVILGSGIVFVGFKYLHLTFTVTFIISAAVLLLAAGMMLTLKHEQVEPQKSYLKLRKEYSLFYILAVLFGSRKQLFITFAPWVIVTIYHQPTQTIATLMVIGGIIGILFQPLLGQAIDKFGERTILMLEALIFVFVCLGYGFSGQLFSEHTAFLITCACYLLDQVLMSVSMARSTYIKKIALQQSDIQPALSASLTIDHLFSISIALLGGVIWSTFGYQYVFLAGTVIAALNFIFASRIRLPASAKVSTVIIPEPPAV